MRRYFVYKTEAGFYQPAYYRDDSSDEDDKSGWVLVSYPRVSEAEALNIAKRAKDNYEADERGKAEARKYGQKFV